MESRVDVVDVQDLHPHPHTAPTPSLTSPDHMMGGALSCDGVT